MWKKKEKSILLNIFHKKKVCHCWCIPGIFFVEIKKMEVLRLSSAFKMVPDILRLQPADFFHAKTIREVAIVKKKGKWVVRNVRNVKANKWNQERTLCVVTWSPAPHKYVNIWTNQRARTWSRDLYGPIRWLQLPWDTRYRPQPNWCYFSRHWTMKCLTYDFTVPT